MANDTHEKSKPVLITGGLAADDRGELGGTMPIDTQKSKLALMEAWLPRIVASWVDTQKSKPVLMKAWLSKTVESRDS